MKEPTIAQLVQANLIVGQDTLTGSGSRSWGVFRDALADQVPLTAEWLDYRKGYVKVPPRLEGERTYEECMAWSLDMRESVVELTLWNGDNLYGEPIDRRCHWTYHLDVKAECPVALRDMLTRKLARNLRDYASEAYVKRQVAQDEKAINSIITGLLERTS